jgi:hypothetical protein
MSVDDEFNKKMETHYAAVGKTASTWAEFEHRIQWAIWNLARLDNLTGACITTQIGNSARLLDAVIALLRLRDAPEAVVRPVSKFAEKVARKQRQRNRIVHDPWSFRIPSGEAHRFEVSAHREVISGAVPHSTTQITGFIKEVTALLEEFDSLLSRVSLPSSPAEPT